MSEQFGEINDWNTISYFRRKQSMLANVTGSRAFCKLDLGFHLYFNVINRVTFRFQRHKVRKKEKRNVCLKKIQTEKSLVYLCPRGTIAQLVEQRTENPCVPGSNPGSTTKKTNILVFFFTPDFPIWRFLFENRVNLQHP